MANDGAKLLLLNPMMVETGYLRSGRGAFHLSKRLPSSNADENPLDLWQDQTVRVYNMLWNNMLYNIDKFTKSFRF